MENFSVRHLKRAQRGFRCALSTNGWGHPWIKVCNSIEELLLNLRYGQFRVIATAVCNRLKKMTGRFKYK